MLAATPVHRVEAVAWASAAMRSVELDIACARTLDCNVMISGESGVGKRAIAHRLHRQSGRASRPLWFIRPVNVLDVAGSLITTLVEASPDGTILLEHPQCASPSVQGRLLQFVERRTKAKGTPKGTVETHDVRFLTITNCDLHDLVERNHFCESLFYRLNPIHLVIPPLRTHPEDIAVLLEYFFSIHACATCPRLSAEAWEQIVTYAWPGNVRELEEVAAMLASRELRRPVELDDLPPYMLRQ